MWKKDFYVAILLLTFCVPVYLVANSYPHESSYFPRIIIGLFALVTFVLLGKAILARRKEKREELPEPQDYGETIPTWKRQVVRKVAIMLCGSIIYVLVLPSVGFFLTTLVYLPLMIKLLGVRKLKTIVISASVVIFFIYLVFRAFLNVPIPQGIAF